MGLARVRESIQEVFGSCWLPFRLRGGEKKKLPEEILHKLKSWKEQELKTSHFACAKVKSRVFLGTNYRRQ